MISEKYNFIFFHIPKAAGTSVINALDQTMKNDVLVNESNEALVNFLNQKGEQWPNHATCGHLMEFLGEIVYNSYFKFCFVRNPWDRLVSLYHYTLQKEADKYLKQEKEMTDFTKNILNAGSFEKWIKSKDIGTAQMEIISNYDNELMVDFVGKSENIQADFSYICGLIGIENINVPKANVSNHKDYKEYYTNETKEIVEEQYAKDVEYFDYRFEENSINSKLQINSKFLKKKERDIVQIVKLNNLNEWCEVPDSFENQPLVVHPNDVDAAQLEIEIYLSKTAQNLISSLEFNAVAFDENEQNQGILMDIKVKNNAIVILKETHKLEPRIDKKIQLSFSQVKNCHLNIKLRSSENASSNAFCGTRLSSISIRK